MSSNYEPIYKSTANLSNSDCLNRYQVKSYIETPVSLESLQMRERVTRNVALSPSPDNDHPVFKFIGAENFKIIDVQVLTKIPVKLDEKKIELLIIISYDLIYSDGKYDLAQADSAYFELPIDKIKCPDCNVKRYQSNYLGNSTCTNCMEKSCFTVEALAQTFGEMICSYTGALIIDLGAFFVINSIFIMQLLTPSALDCVQYQEQREASVSETGETCNFDLI